MNMTPEEFKEIALQALEDLNDNAFYEDGYSEHIENCYLLLKKIIENSKFNKVS